MNVRSLPNCVLTDGDIEDVVMAIRAIDHKSAWDRVLEVGRLIFDGILAGNEAEWRSRRSQKNVSLRKLVQHPLCPFKKSALCSAVNIHLFMKTEPSARRMTGITPTHVAQTLTMKPPHALELLGKASAAGWSARELGQAVRNQRKAAGERRGRPVSSTDRKAEVVGRRALAALREMHERLAVCKSIGDETLRGVEATLREIEDLTTCIHSLPIVTRRSGFILMAKIKQSGEPGAVPALAAGQPT